MRILLFELKIKLEGSPTIKEVSNYIKEAVEHWGGSLDPEDDMFSSNIKYVLVTALQKKDHFTFKAVRKRKEVNDNEPKEKGGD